MAVHFTADTDRNRRFSPEMKVRTIYGCLCALALLLFSGLAQGAAQEEFSLSGPWVGVYNLAGQVGVFFVDWEADENGRFQSYQAPRSKPIQNFSLKEQAVQFTTAVEDQVLSFSGEWKDGAFAGDVQSEEESGRFYLAPLAEITAQAYDPAIGSYDVEGIPPILLARSDELNQLFYQQGDHQVRLFPLGGHVFLTALGQKLSVESDQIQIQDPLAVEPSILQSGRRTDMYREEPVTVQNSGVELRGSLFLPEGDGSYPGIVLLHGAGAAERHFYRIFADLFARNGIAALIFDKRGHGQSAGGPDEASLQDLASDAGAAVQFLAQQSEIDAAQISIWGFSQGGRILPQVAAHNDGVASLIAVSAPAMSANSLELWRQDMRQQANGESKSARDLWLKISRLRQSFPLQRAGEDQMLHPIAFWEQVDQPVLLIYGLEDRVVPPGPSARAIQTALEEAGNSAVSLALFPEANHDIMALKTAVPTFAPGYFDTMTSWLQNGSLDRGNDAPSGAPGGITGEFRQNGRYGPVPWYGQFWFQLLIALFVGGVFLWTAVRVLVQYHHKEATPLAWLAFIVAVCGLFLLVLLGFALVATLQWGTVLGSSWLLRLLGLITAVFCALYLFKLWQTWRSPANIDSWYFLNALAVSVFLGLMVYWTMV